MTCGQSVGLNKSISPQVLAELGKRKTVIEKWKWTTKVNRKNKSEGRTTLESENEEYQGFVKSKVKKAISESEKKHVLVL